MDIRVLMKHIFLCLIVLTSELNSQESTGFGHYKCTWHSGPANQKAKLESINSDQRECNNWDSERITSYIHRCTKQNFVPLLACREDGTWNCQSFISMCKTLIHTDTGSPMEQISAATPNVQTQVLGPSQKGPQKDSVPGLDSDIKRSKMFSPDENYFTMKEMAVAVLVSFITGATMLAIVICVVWRCRHSHMNSEHVREAAHQSAKRLAAIHAITHIAHAIGGGHDTMASSTYSNPQYGQIIASQEILEDALTEHDRIYEEIFSGHKPSSKNTECIYANVNKARKKNSVIRQSSLGDLRRIDESAEESDVGYEADSNATPQNPRRQIYNWGHLMQNGPASPAFNENRCNTSSRNGDLLGMPLSFRNCVSQTSNQVRDEKENNVIKHDVDKCDSGYHDELSETLLETIKICENSDVKKPSPMDNGERKQSLRL